MNYGKFVLHNGRLAFEFGSWCKSYRFVLFRALKRLYYIILEWSSLKYGIFMFGMLLPILVISYMLKIQIEFNILSWISIFALCYLCVYATFCCCCDVFIHSTLTLRVLISNRRWILMLESRYVIKLIMKLNLLHFNLLLNHIGL